MAQLDPRIDAIRVTYGLASEDFWEIKQKPGTWVAKHAALEVAAVKAGIRFDMPQVIEQNAAGLVTSIAVQGTMGDRTEWSIGETNPSNYHVTGKQPSYPWAMAEKRAKDRVILKLLGIHGLVYSDEEGDFKGEAASPAAQSIARLSAYRATQLLRQDVLLDSIDTMKTPNGLDKLEATIKGDLAFIPLEWESMFLERIKDRRKELNGEEVTRPEVVDPNKTLDRQFADTMGQP